MAETAKVLNPNRIVVLPDLKAGCSLVDSCPAEAIALSAAPTRTRHRQLYQYFVEVRPKATSFAHRGNAARL